MHQKLAFLSAKNGKNMGKGSPYRDPPLVGRDTPFPTSNLLDAFGASMLAPLRRSTQLAPSAFDLGAYTAPRLRGDCHGSYGVLATPLPWLLFGVLINAKTVCLDANVFA